MIGCGRTWLWGPASVGTVSSRALVIALLVAPMSEPAPGTPVEPAPTAEAVAVGLFFWILVLVVLGLILASLFLVV